MRREQAVVPQASHVHSARSATIVCAAVSGQCAWTTNVLVQFGCRQAWFVLARRLFHPDGRSCSRPVSLSPARLSCLVPHPPIAASRLHLSSACDSAVLATINVLCGLVCSSAICLLSSPLLDSSASCVHRLLPALCSIDLLGFERCHSAGPSTPHNGLSCSASVSHLSARPRRCSLHPPDHCRCSAHRPRSRFCAPRCLTHRHQLIDLR